MDKEKVDDLKMFAWCVFLVAMVWLLSGCGTPASPDLFTSSQINRATADAAIQQAEFQEKFLTATAQAPIMDITSTAAAFAMEQSYAAATSTAAVQTQVAVGTMTAMSWTPTPNATTTAMSAQQYWTATAMSLALARDQKTNDLRAFWSYVAGAALLVLSVFAGYVQVRKLSFIPHPVDERGKIIPMINVLDGVAWDMDRAANGMVGTTRRFLESLPEITATRQDTVTARALMMDMTTRARLPRRSLDRQEQPLLPSPMQSIESHFLLPSWEIINGWDGKGIPYYTARGLETIDIENVPHISVLGATTTGKSRRFLRPLITCALAAGHRVVIVGKMADYDAFEGHPNATLLNVSKITEPGQAQRYAKILEAIVVEMNRRDDILTSMHRSTWTHAGRNRTFVVLDEVGNALRLMEKGTSDQCKVWIEGLVSESRKYGFNVVIANQRATSLRSILSQTGNAVFRVDADEEKAHKSLMGASMLHTGYFLARFDIPKIAGGFEPTNEQIQSFLASRPVEKVDADDQWIEGVVTDAPAKLDEGSDEEPSPAKSVGEWVLTLDAKAMKVIEFYQLGGMSDSEIAEKSYGYSNGTSVRRVKGLIEQYQRLIGTTTATTTTNMPNFGAVAA